MVLSVVYASRSGRGGTKQHFGVRASSRSVLRLTRFHCQAAPVVLATSGFSCSSTHRSCCTQPVREQASKTTWAIVWRVSSLRSSSAEVRTVRKVVSLVVS